MVSQIGWSSTVLVSIGVIMVSGTIIIAMNDESLRDIYVLSYCCDPDNNIYKSSYYDLICTNMLRKRKDSYPRGWFCSHLNQRMNNYEQVKNIVADFSISFYRFISNRS
jgi:hypothetical protein